MFLQKSLIYFPFTQKPMGQCSTRLKNFERQTLCDRFWQKTLYGNYTCYISILIVLSRKPALYKLERIPHFQHYCHNAMICVQIRNLLLFTASYSIIIKHEHNHLLTNFLKAIACITGTNLQINCYENDSYYAHYAIHILNILNTGDIMRVNSICGLSLTEQSHEVKYSALTCYIFFYFNLLSATAQNTYKMGSSSSFLLLQMGSIF